MTTKANGARTEVDPAPSGGGLHAKLADAAQEVGSIPMLGQMTGGAGNYSFHRAADVFNAVRKAFYSRGITIVLNYLGHDLKEYSLSSGRTMKVAEADYQLVLTDADTGEQLHIPVAAAAQDNGDKYLNKAQTIALKNAFKAMFLIAEPGDDPDDEPSPADHEVQASPKKPAPAPAKKPARAKAPASSGTPTTGGNAFRLTDVEPKGGAGGPASEKQKRLIRARLGKDLGIKDEVDQGAWVLKVTDDTLENLNWKWMDVLLAEIDAHASSPAPPSPGADEMARANAAQEVIDSLVSYAEKQGAPEAATAVTAALGELGIADGLALVDANGEAHKSDLDKVRNKIDESIANDDDIPF